MTMRMVVPGTNAPVGWFSDITIEDMPPLELEQGQLEWKRLDITKFKVSEPMHLMLIEGAAPAWLFMGARIETIDGSVDPVHGPFFLLGARYPPIHTAPFIIQNLILCMPTVVPGDTKLNEILPALVSSLALPQAT